MEFKFVTLTPDNLASEHLSCIIRTKKAHPGVEAKRRWLAERLPEGHVFRKLDAKEKETAFIEYAPLETAWVPITGDNYLYLYCLWVTGSFKGKGIGQALMDSCLADAKRQGKAGVCMLGSQNPGCPTRRSLRNRALKSSIKPKTAMSFWLYRGTAQNRNLRKTQNKCELRIRN